MGKPVPSYIFKETLRLLETDKWAAEPGFLKRAEALYERLLEAVNGRSRRIFSDIFCDGPSVDFKGYFSLKSNDLSKILKHCQRCVFIAVTLGSDVDRLIARVQKEDMADAVVLDALASAEVEHMCDYEECLLTGQISSTDFLTMRFSPGYGDVPLEVSDNILDALQAKKDLGINITKSFMLVPVKSITAIVGISDRKEFRGKSCEFCTITEFCKYRKRGEFCGIQDN